MQEEVQRVEECGCEIKGTKRARSRKVKYLGVWVDESLTWVDHVRGSSKKVFGRPGKAEKAKRDPAALKKSIYNALVLSHLDYCCVLWQECRIQLQKRVERIQNYAVRLIFQNHQGHLVKN